MDFFAAVSTQRRGVWFKLVEATEAVFHDEIPLRLLILAFRLGEILSELI